MSAPTSSLLLQRIAQRLTECGESLACIEIGSGGQVSRRLTSEPGSSAFFAGALILAADAAFWPHQITGCSGWQAEPAGSSGRLQELATVAQKQFSADWGLAVEWTPPAPHHFLNIAIRVPDGSLTFETSSLGTEASQCGAEQLVQCVLRLLAQRLEERTKELP